MPKEIFSCNSHWNPFVLFGDQSSVEIIYFPGCSFSQIANLAVVPGFFTGIDAIAVDDMVVVTLVVKTHVINSVVQMLEMELHTGYLEVDAFSAAKEVINAPHLKLELLVHQDYTVLLVECQGQMLIAYIDEVIAIDVGRCRFERLPMTVSDQPHDGIITVIDSLFFFLRSVAKVAIRLCRSGSGSSKQSQSSCRMRF